MELFTKQDIKKFRQMDEDVTKWEQENPSLLTNESYQRWVREYKNNILYGDNLVKCLSGEKYRIY